MTPAQLLGLDDGALVTLAGGQRLLPQVADAFARLQAEAAAAGFDLAIASGYRSFERQLAIFNGKASGERAVHDDEGQPVPLAQLPPAGQLAAILRFSALPGCSRHHWGTDLDIYDAAAMPAGYQLQLKPAEVAPGGMFDPLHRWLDERMAMGQSRGFYRPYAEDRGGVAPERWHLSYAPLATGCEAQLATPLLRAAWNRCELALRDEIERDIDALLARYVRVPAGWCPAGK